jgi:hypothetical protein
MAFSDLCGFLLPVAHSIRVWATGQHTGKTCCPPCIFAYRATGQLKHNTRLAVAHLSLFLGQVGNRKPFSRKDNQVVCFVEAAQLPTRFAEFEART